MTDVKKVIKGIEQCLMSSDCEAYETQCSDCPYFNPDVTVNECREPLQNDVIELLMQRVKRKPVQAGLEGGGTTWWYVCEDCHTAINYKDNFCRECGRPLDWDGMR